MSESTTMTATETPQGYETLLVETDDTGVATVTINRPDKLNALSAQVLEELNDCLDELETDDEVRGIIVTGAGGKAFVAGADIAWMAEISPMVAADFSRLGQAAFFKLEESRKPTIAAVDGFALGGGCELAMGCDFIIAGDNSKFGQPEAKLGLVPGFMGSQRLSRLVGPARAKEILMSARMVDVDEAHRIGLVAEVVPAGTALERAREKMAEIVANGPIAVELCKRLVNQGLELDKHTAGDMESDAFGLVFSTEDHDEGIAAFLEKREPKFTGQ